MFLMKRFIASLIFVTFLSQICQILCFFLYNICMLVASKAFKNMLDSNP